MASQPLCNPDSDADGVGVMRFKRSNKMPAPGTRPKPKWFLKGPSTVRGSMAKEELNEWEEVDLVQAEAEKLQKGWG